MSIIVAVRKGNRAVLASDSQFSQGSIRVSANYKKNHQKIFPCGTAFIGFVGWTAMLNIFENILERYPDELNFSSRSHIFKTFLFLHAKLKEEYFVETKEDNDQPVESSQWDCMIASPGGIFSVQSYREVTDCQKFWADGSGTRFALGAMHAVYDWYEDIEKVALAGITAAAQFDQASGLPAQIYSVELSSNLGQ